MNEVLKGSKKTPIEIMLQVDGEGKTTARKLYEFLNLSKGQFARWAKTNILENSFAEDGVDFEGFDINVEGNLTKDYKLTASFAKKLAMSSQTERGEQAREYFVKIEEQLKQIADKKGTADSEKAKIMRAEAMLLNAKNRTFKTLMQSLDKYKNLSPIAIEVFGLKALESAFGARVGNYLPETEKTYSAEEIGKMLGITANKVGRIANTYELKTAEYGVFKLDKSRYSNKEVENFYYNQRGVEKIQQIYQKMANKAEEKAAKGQPVY